MSTGSLRLASGNSSAGRVEIYKDGQWGTVCDDDWDTYDADVVCRELGFWHGAASSDSYFGEGTGPIHMDDVRCTSYDDRLIDCAHTEVHNCAHKEDAGVVCILGKYLSWLNISLQTHQMKHESLWCRSLAMQL